MNEKLCTIINIIVITGLLIFSGVQTYRLGRYRDIINEATERSEQYAESIATVRLSVGAVRDILSEDVLTVSDVITQIRTAREIFEAMEKYLDSVGVDTNSFYTNNDINN